MVWSKIKFYNLVSQLDSSNSFDLIDPLNFKIDLSDNSKFIVNDNNYDLSLLEMFI